MYITLEDYYSLTDSELNDERLFKTFCFEACRVMDMHTTGIDNVKKLKKFFPTDEEDAETVKRCAVKLVNTLYQLHKAESVAEMARGYVHTEKGLRGQIISQESAGNESISYSEPKNARTVIDEAASDKTARDRLLSGIVQDYLRGVEDSNGVSLMYMGQYPRRYLC